MKDSGRGPKGRSELETQWWIWDVLYKMSPSWTSLPELCCGYLSINKNNCFERWQRVLSSAKANFLVQGLVQSLGQEPKTTATTECPNVFVWHTTSWGSGLYQWFPSNPCVVTPYLRSFSKCCCGKILILMSSFWYHLLTHNTGLLNKMLPIHWGEIFVLEPIVRSIADLAGFESRIFYLLAL